LLFHGLETLGVVLLDLGDDDESLGGRGVLRRVEQPVLSAAGRQGVSVRCANAG
jgi:hypothetical protein